MSYLKTSRIAAATWVSVALLCFFLVIKVFTISPSIVRWQGDSVMTVHVATTACLVARFPICSLFPAIYPTTILPMTWHICQWPTAPITQKSVIEAWAGDLWEYTGTCLKCTATSA